MLVLSRKVNESIIISDGQIVITVVEVAGNKVRIGVQAPKDVPVHRQEIFDLIQGGQPDQTQANNPPKRRTTVR